jgi:uncharacterized membrane protein
VIELRIVRSRRERFVQTACFEVVGIALVAPIYAAAFGSALDQGVALIALLSIVVLVWSPIHNTAFDLVEWSWTRRMASDRPHWLRLVHAVSHEVTAVSLTCPILLWGAGHSLAEALALNVGLTIAYAIYAYFFHLAYDIVRPVRPHSSDASSSSIVAVMSTTSSVARF